MKPEEAKRGVRVRCIHDYSQTKRRPTDPWSPEQLSLPKKSKVYTIRDIIIAGDGDFGLLFLEIQNPIFFHDIGGNREPCFGLSRFEVVE